MDEYDEKKIERLLSEILKGGYVSGSGAVVGGDTKKSEYVIIVLSYTLLKSQEKIRYLTYALIVWSIVLAMLALNKL